VIFSYPSPSSGRVARVSAPGGAGKSRGEIVATGTPENILKEKRSYTGQYLKPVLAKKAAGPKKKGQKAAE